MFVECNNISKKFGNKLVLNAVNLEIEKNEIFCLQGANGSGKTTLIKVICDLYKPTSGNLVFADELKKARLAMFHSTFLYTKI